MSIRLDTALAVLDRLVKAGWEFPDATTYVVREYRVDLDNLREAYDELCVEQAETARNRAQQAPETLVEPTLPATQLAPGIRLW